MRDYRDDAHDSGDGYNDEQADRERDVGASAQPPNRRRSFGRLGFLTKVYEGAVVMAWVFAGAGRTPETGFGVDGDGALR
jgi:hypothetical protein